MGKQSGSNVGKIVIKCVATSGPSPRFAYFGPDPDGWDTCERQRVAQPFDDLREAKDFAAHVADKGLLTPRQYAAFVDCRLAFVRIVPRKVSKC